MLPRRQLSKFLKVPALQWLRNGVLLAEPFSEVN
jgi:hypothetical protein